MKKRVANRSEALKNSGAECFDFKRAGFDFACSYCYSPRVSFEY